MLKVNLALFLGAVSCNINAAELTANVGEVNINQDHGGVFVQLVEDGGGAVTVNEVGCSGDHVFFTLDSEINKAKLSAILSASVASKKIKVVTQGCHSSSNAPLLKNLKFGV